MQRILHPVDPVLREKPLNIASCASILRPVLTRTLFASPAIVALVLGCSAANSSSGGGAAAGGAGGLGTGGVGAQGGSIGLGSGPGTGGAVSSCKVTETESGVGTCTQKAPPNSFDPVVQWTWTVPASAAPYPGSVVTPLVGNLTDDNNDGAIDLCDVPDIVVATMDGSPSPNSPGSLYMLAGDSGKQELEFQAKVNAFITPALGDIDGDGVMEVVTSDPEGHVIAFENDGSVAFVGDLGSWSTTFNTWCTSVSLYDLDADGSVEIIIGFEVFDAKGKRLWGFPDLGNVLCATQAAADLDGDGKLELVMGNGAYRADGTPYFQIPGTGGHPMIANLDSDPEPEIVFTGIDGITVVEHDGTVKFGPVRPTDPNPSIPCWCKPGAIHDFDGDGKSDAAIGTCSDYSVYTIGSTAIPKWSEPVFDSSGLATGTAFDFLGDGVADAIYADEHQAYVFDGATGATELTTPRESGTFVEYPVVADVDNDGSAEIVIVSNWGWFGNGTDGPTVTVVKDSQDRWIPARRIWNQHSYSVTNVREDGTIPTVPKKSWQLLNTFRTNSQINSAGDCTPIPR